MKKLLKVILIPLFLAITFVFYLPTVKGLTFTDTFFTYHDKPYYSSMTPYVFDYPNPISYYYSWANIESPAVGAVMGQSPNGFYEDELHYGGHLLYTIPLPTGSAGGFLQFDADIDIALNVNVKTEIYNGSSWDPDYNDGVDPTYIHFIFFRVTSDTYSYVRSKSYIFTYDTITYETPFIYDKIVVLLEYEDSFDGISERLIQVSFNPDVNMYPLFEIGIYKPPIDLESYSTGFTAGRTYGETIGYTRGLTAGETAGMPIGRAQLYDNGSTAYSLDPTGAVDYGLGYDAGFYAGVVEGGSRNVNAGITTFLSNIDKWIVPAIVVVILLGGFVTIAVRKRNGSGGD